MSKFTVIMRDKQNAVALLREAVPNAMSVADAVHLIDTEAKRAENWDAIYLRKIYYATIKEHEYVESYTDMFMSRVIRKAKEQFAIPVELRVKLEREWDDHSTCIGKCTITHATLEILREYFFGLESKMSPTPTE